MNLGLIGKAMAAGLQNQASTSGIPSTLPTLFVIDPSKSSIGEIIQAVIAWILVLAAAIAIVYLVYGGILYITAGPDAEKATKGRTAIVNAVIGIVIIALSFVILQLVANVLKQAAT